jgi:hypothetical protein
LFFLFYAMRNMKEIRIAGIGNPGIPLGWFSSSVSGEGVGVGDAVGEGEGDGEGWGDGDGVGDAVARTP